MQEQGLGAFVPLCLLESNVLFSWVGWGQTLASISERRGLEALCAAISGC